MPPITNISSHQEVLDFLRRCQHYSHPRVREETFISFGKIKGPEVEAFLLAALNDSDITILDRAVLALGSLQTTNDRALAFLRKALRRKVKNEVEADESLQISSCLALEAIASAHPEVVEPFEAILLEALSKDSQSVFLGWMRDKYFQKSSGVRNGMCKLLGKIGTSTSLPVLQALLEDKDSIVRNTTRQAIQKIRERGGSHEMLPYPSGSSSLKNTQ